MDDQTPQQMAYYFVTFGRESGGLLDLLGLSPTASEIDVRKRESEYRKEVATEYNRGFNAMREKQKSKEITSEQFDAETLKLEEIKTGKLLDLNKRKEKYTAMLKSARQRRRSGSQGEYAIWSSMYRLSEIAMDYLSDLGLGRGSVLELLGLPATATEKEVMSAEINYRDHIEADQHARDVALKEKLSRQEINQVQFADEIKQLEAAKKETLAELKKRMDAYTANLTKLPQRSGQSLKAGLLEQLVGYNWPLPCQDAPDPVGVLAKVRRSLDAIRCRQVGLADDYWGHLQHTNRAFWKDQVDTWAAEFSLLGPDFQAPDATARLARKDAAEFSGLCKPYKLSIDSLRLEAMDDIASQPNRGRPQALPNQDLGRLLLEALLHGSLPGADPEKPESVSGNVGLDPKDFSALMAALLSASEPDNQ